MIRAMEFRIGPAGVGDVQQVVADHPRYWGERDLRALHQLPLVHEFGQTCFVARSGDGIVGYLLGFVTPSGTGYEATVVEDYNGPGAPMVVFSRTLSD
jgi:hypothetical protein